MKDELGGEIMKEIVDLKPEICSYLAYGGSVDKKAKVTKNVLLDKK